VGSGGREPPRVWGAAAPQEAPLTSSNAQPKLKFIRFGDITGPKPNEFIGFGDITGPKPCEFIGFGDITGPKPYEFIGFGDPISGSVPSNRILPEWLPGQDSPTPRYLERCLPLKPY
jgi:hypothetical protein